MGVFADAVKSALEPGTGDKFVIAVNAVLVTLLLVIGLTIWTGIEDSIHMFVFLFLAVGLTLSINWFIMEARSLQAQGKLQWGADDSATTNEAKQQELKKTD
ncbi:hypothetical protein H310_10949 [Aphanomyces invadans]|nr:hypothetical protein H310_10949 [Aphanomyces invadans]ETV95471.1 hypothetical protein H310_10949 [Aphanomyces invadans]|eukprot:XP_008875664.1 hypothetical protein H310_10949 [Aphanomyces invadans]